MVYKNPKFPHEGTFIAKVSIERGREPRVCRLRQLDRSPLAVNLRLANQSYKKKTFKS